MDYSSIPCKFFKVGHCKYGASCQFLHPPTCTIPQCPKMSCPNRHPRQCKHHLKFGSCKFGDMCSFSHITASPSITSSPPTCSSNSRGDEIISELETLKLTINHFISTLSNQLAEHGSILSTLLKQYPSTSLGDQPPPGPSIVSTTSPPNTTPNTMNLLAPPQTSLTLPSANTCPQQQPLSITLDNYSQQRPLSNPPSILPSPGISGNTLQFSCEQCNYQCSLKSVLKRHITMKHKNSPPPVSTPQIPTPVPSIAVCPPHCHLWIPQPGQTFKCNICPSIFPSVQSHGIHIINFHPEHSNNVSDYCPENSCTNLDVAESNGGCECQCYVCDPEL